MKQEEKRPRGAATPTQAATEKQGKYTNYLVDNQTKTPKLTRRQKKVYDLLRMGKQSVADITIATGYCDPRGFFRDLIAKGINVKSEWIERDDVRFKKYWIA